METPDLLTAMRGLLTIPQGAKIYVEVEFAIDRKSVG
jgi:hypothetical protein